MCLLAIWHRCWRLRHTSVRLFQNRLLVAVLVHKDTAKQPTIRHVHGTLQLPPISQDEECQAMAARDPTAMRMDTMGSQIDPCVANQLPSFQPENCPRGLARLYLVEPDLISRVTGL